MVIAIVSLSYPHLYNPVEYAFVKELVDTFVRQGHNCYVIAPFNILRHRKRIKKHYSYNVEASEVHCYRPYYLSFSNKFGFLSKIGALMLNKVAYRALRRIPQKIDVIYGHFWRGAYMGYRYAVEENIPLYVATGESVIDFERNNKTTAFCDYVSGVICVSTKNKNESICKGLAVENKCIVIPNAVNVKIFYRHDKSECRKKLGYSPEEFIVIFVGNFSERKGVLRVAEALKKVGNITSLFIGQGPLEPICNGIKHKGPVRHELLPMYLSASDVFVLPTLHEGCCNAIVEAMACGLPIISSNLSFNQDILDDTNSILINPMDIDSIAEAIQILKGDEDKRTRMSIGALERAKKMSIDERAKKIIDFILRNSFAK